MLTCTKIYRDIPFAHRQHLHDGHCAFIQGHNWAITLTFACNETDVNGFVVDFGKLGYLKDWNATHLDHACLFNENDTQREPLLATHGQLFKAYILPNCSCEGIARHLYEVFNPMVREATDHRVWIRSIEIEEDSKNSAAFSPAE